MVGDLDQEWSRRMEVQEGGRGRSRGPVRLLDSRKGGANAPGSGPTSIHEHEPIPGGGQPDPMSGCNIGRPPIMPGPGKPPIPPQQAAATVRYGASSHFGLVKTFRRWPYADRMRAIEERTSWGQTRLLA